MDKKVKMANVLLKGAIIGVGSLAGFALSRLFRVEAEETDGTMSVADNSIDVPYEEVNEEVTTEET